MSTPKSAVRRGFRWATSVDLYDGGRLDALEAVAGSQRNRTKVIACE